MVACVLIPRFSLRVACPERFREAVALAPSPGGRQAVGEVSAAAEAAGVEAGMRLGEALARCPSLGLIPADPARAGERWDELMERLEGIGAEVESERSGEAFFAVEGLRRIHGGEVAGVVAAARSAAPMPVRIGVSRGWSRRWCSARSLVKRRSIHGHRVRMPKAMPGNRMAGQNTSDRVKPNRFRSQGGPRRRAPSRKPMYQSGWAGEVTLNGSNGP
jgi:protein ImuB